LREASVDTQSILQISSTTTSKKMTTTTGSNAAKINNGVNVDALLGAREARSGH
jgi:hypothetical protein